MGRPTSGKLSGKVFSKFEISNIHLVASLPNVYFSDVLIYDNGVIYVNSVMEIIFD